MSVFRHFWNTTGFLLAFGRYYRRPNPYKAFRRLPGYRELQQATPTASGKRVLLLPIRVSSVSNMVEGLIGAGLVLDGNSVFALMDGGTFRYSENANVGKSWLTANALSVFEQGQFCETFNITPKWLSDELDREEIERCSRLISKMPLGQLLDFQYLGARVGHHARFSVMRYLRQETVEIAANLSLFRHFVMTGILTAMAVNNVVRDQRITHALLSHGIYSTWGSALDVLRNLGVVVSVWGRGYVKGDIILGRNQSYLAEGISETAAEIRLLVGNNENLIAEAKAYIADKTDPNRSGDVERYYDGRADQPVELDADGYAGVVGVFPNIPWDGAIFAGSDYTPTLRAFAARIVAAAERFPRHLFLVRCHPAETHRSGNASRETFASFFGAGRPTNIRLIPAESSLTSYQVAQHSSVAIVFGTTMGLELALRGVPVVQTGRHYLSNKNVVYEVSSDAELDTLLNATVTHELKMSPDMIRSTDIFAAYHITLSHVHDDMMSNERYAFSGYKIASVTELAGDMKPSCSAIKNFVLGRTNKCLNPYAKCA